MALIGNLLIGFENITCPRCGLTFGLPARTLELWQRDETTFRCPNGHRMYRPNAKKQEKTEFLQSEVQRLKEENINMRQQLEHAEAKAKSIAEPKEIVADSATKQLVEAPAKEGRRAFSLEKRECLICHKKIARKFMPFHLRTRHAITSPAERQQYIG